ncbi:MAG: hypothetical protein AAF975_05040, partial [Spirochaetota bacterium]
KILYQNAWGATTDPWSSPVYTPYLNFIIQPEQLPASGSRFEVRVRTYQAITRPGSRILDRELYSDWVRISPITISFSHPQTEKFRNPQKREAYRASLIQMEVLSDSDAGSEAEFYGNFSVGVFKDELPSPEVVSADSSAAPATRVAQTIGGILWVAYEDAPVSIQEVGSKSYFPGEKSLTEMVDMASYSHGVGRADPANYRDYYLGISARLWEDDFSGDDNVGDEFIRVGRLVDYIVGKKNYTFTLSGDGNTVRITVLFEPANSGSVLVSYPPKPSGVRATDNGNGLSIELSWDRITDENVTGYEVSWGVASDPWNNPVFVEKDQTSMILRVSGRGSRTVESRIRTVGNSKFSESLSGWVRANNVNLRSPGIW